MIPTRVLDIIGDKYGTSIHKMNAAKFGYSLAQQMNKQEILKLLMDFAVIYHESKEKDIANDAAEFLDDHIKTYPQF